MKRSTQRILTTHTGSFPRPDELLSLLTARETGTPYEPAALEAAVGTAVHTVVRQQLDAGIDVVNDGEMSRFGFATYLLDRVTGFEGEGRFPAFADLQDYPEFAQRQRGDGTRVLRTPVCTGPITAKDPEAVHRDIATFTAALQGVQPEDTFLTAASPGVIAGLLQNQYYPSYEAYLYALAEAMKPEYSAITQAGFLLQVDCPDLAGMRHQRFATVSLEEFRRIIALHVEVLNAALADIAPDRIRLHVCWGNYEGPHHRDVPLKDILDIVLHARPTGLSVEAANPRHGREWKMFQESPLPEGKVLLPGVIDSTTNFIEHPELVAERIVRFASLVGRENVIAGTDCGFKSNADRPPRVDTRIVWAKLQSLAEGARIASQQLW